MGSRSSLRQVVGAALCLIPVAAMGCGGRGPLDTDVASYDAPDASGLGDDGIGPTSGAGSHPVEPTDAGKDAGVPAIPGLANIPGLAGLLGADAGPLGACFACAEKSCGTQVTACLGAPACIEEGLCDVTTCLGGAGATGTMTGGLGGLDLSCFMTCGSNQQASGDLISALTCVLGSCASSCLSAASSLGGASGAGLGGLGNAGNTGITPR